MPPGQVPNVVTIGGRSLLYVKPIAEGGFSYVDLAVDTATNEFFALKSTSCPNKEVLDQVFDEIALLTQLPPHPNIVEFYGFKLFEEQTQFPFDILTLYEYCDGGNLLNRLTGESSQDISREEVHRILNDIAMALHHLHTQNVPIFHRDVKLENVLYDSKRELYKLCDFGSATSVVYDTNQMDSQQLGLLRDSMQKQTTLIYRPPEMVDLYRREILNEKVDIWMVGCILYTLYFKHHPFQNDSPALAILAAQVQLTPEELISIPLNDLALVVWCLALSPSDRPSANDILTILNDGSLKGDTFCSLLPQAVADTFAKVVRRHQPQCKEEDLKTKLPLKPKKKKASEPFNTSWSTNVSGQVSSDAAFPCFFEAQPRVDEDGKN